MSEATRMKKMKMEMMTVKPEERKSTAYINLKKFKSLDEYNVGDDCQFALMGKVTSINKDEYGQSMGIEIESIDSLEDEE